MSVSNAKHQAEVRKPNVIGYTELKEKYLKHRYPILMLDRITDYEPGKYIEAIKSVTGNSPDLVGHFPERAIMPGTTVLQSFAQLTIVFFQLTNTPLTADEMTLISSISGRFLAPIPPGELLRFRMEPKRVTNDVIMLRGTATIGDTPVVRAAVTLARAQVARFADVPW